MQLSPHSGDIATATTDLLVLGCFQGSLGDPNLKMVDKALGGALQSSMKDHDFLGKIHQQVVLHSLGKLRAKRVAVFGLGEKDRCGAAEIIQFGGHVHRLGNATGSKQALLVLPEGLVREAHHLAALARGIVLGGYRYGKYKKDGGRKLTMTKFSVALSKSTLDAKGQKSALAFGREVGDAVALARDLVNEPPLDLYPASFAARAQSVGKECGFKVKIYKPEELQRMKMGLLLGVGAGSSRTPRFVHMSYTPPGTAKAKPVVLVGKGVTFDSGGLDIKPPANMLDMKMDMGGAAAVLGAMRAAARLKLEVPIHGLLALAENMPSGTAIRPSDVLHSAAGRTVEVNNTDAEGRLVMADAIHFAHRLKPSVIIDLATLTGACMVALGPYTVGLFSNDDEVANALLSGGARSGEDLWRLPLTRSLEKQLKSDVADTKNTGERFGGAITAALFLQSFIEDDVRWAHMDIAGPAMSDADSGAFTKGGTGVGVATLMEYLAG